MKIVRMATQITAVSLIIASTFGTAVAQSNKTENAINTFGNLLGSLAQAGAKANAQKKWGQVTPEVQQCVNQMFSSKNVTVEQIAAAGIAPNDKRMSPAINACNQYLAAQPKTNFACMVTNAKGQQVTTTCNESYAKEVNGSLIAISGDEFLRAAGNGEKVLAANFETAEAQQARLAKEQRIAAAERQAYLATPEGKRQAALEAAQAKRAEIERRMAAMAEAAERARKPRGYVVACRGEGDATRYNVYSINCSAPIEVINGFRWAVLKLNSDYSDNSNYYRAMASECRDSMYRYAGIDGSVKTNKQIIYGSLSPCNVALQQMAGPSANQVSGKRK